MNNDCNKVVLDQVKECVNRIREGNNPGTESALALVQIAMELTCIRTILQERGHETPN